MRRLSIVWLMFAGCASEEAVPLCPGEMPVRVWSGGDSFLVYGAGMLGDRLIVQAYRPDGDQLGGSTVLVSPCGTEAVVVDTERHLVPIEGLEVQEGATSVWMCGAGAPSSIVEIDRSGETAAREVLTRWTCPYVTEFGAFAGQQESAAGDLGDVWWLPRFPAEDGAVKLADEVYFHEHRRRIGDTVFFLEGITLHAFDLAESTDRALASGVAMFDTTDTHVLWFGGGRAVVRDHDAGTEVELEGPFGTANWRFDASGEYVLRVPYQDPSSPDEPVVSAYDLRGAPMAMPAYGRIIEYLSDGGLLLENVAGQLAHGRIGRSEVTLLDYVVVSPLFESRRVVEGQIEIVNSLGELWRVPLDGTPAARFAVDIGRYEYLDDERLLTIAHGKLTLVHILTKQRNILSEGVYDFHLASEGGIYFFREGVPEDPQLSVWYRPPGGLKLPR
ncbi:MAG: hypothetical protein K1X87_12465 [Dehalococcoidia bacterium]|nr:hypothetical protein [Dehalococcoidia bacterium]